MAVLNRKKASVDLFLRKNTVLFGASGTGKTTITIDAMNELKSVIPNVIVFAPTYEENGAYDDIVHPELIYKDVTIELIKKIYSRQIQAAEVYRIANNVKVLGGIFSVLANDEDRDADEMIKNMESRMIGDIEESDASPGELKGHLKLVKDEADRMRIDLYKKCIRNNESRLPQCGFTDIQRCAIQFIDFNPNVLFIFDDCTSLFTMKFQKSKIIQDLFYRGRHSHITTIWGIHDDKLLESNLRKNVQVSMFTTAECAIAYVNRKANSFSKSKIKLAERTIDKIFESGELPKYSVLIYLREARDQLQYYCADVHYKLVFGCKGSWKFCENVQEARQKSRTGKNMKKYTFGKYS